MVKVMTVSVVATEVPIASGRFGGVSLKKSVNADIVPYLF